MYCVFAKTVWILLKTEDVVLRVVISFEQKLTFVKDVAPRRKKVKADEDSAKEHWNFKGAVPTDKVATARVRGKLVS